MITLATQGTDTGSGQRQRWVRYGDMAVCSIKDVGGNMLIYGEDRVS